MYKHRPINYLKWMFIVFLLGFTALLMTFGENSIDQVIRPFCPAGWWHTSAFWAHCAYPPISIAKYTSMYLGYLIFALLVVQLLAPSSKLLVSVGLLLTFMGVPTFSLLFDKFSWVAFFSLIGTSALALIFILVSRQRLTLRSRGTPQKRGAPCILPPAQK